MGDLTDRRALFPLIRWRMLAEALVYRYSIESYCTGGCQRDSRNERLVNVRHSRRW